jgi:hypothetical protein
MDVNIKQVTGVDPPIPLAPVEISSIDVIKRIEQIAPVAVHVKELNQIDPLTVESLRVDAARNIEPLRIDRLNVSHLPMVNLSLSTLPQVDINIRRIPPLEVSLHQEFELPSRYMMHARILGIELARLEIHGTTRVVPRDCARREVSRVHEQSFPDVAAAGNPASTMPAAVVPTAGVARIIAALASVAGSAVAGAAALTNALSPGQPQFRYDIGGPSTLSAGD